MSTLTITKSYSDASVLYESDLDNFKNDAETFFNTTKITGDNIQTNILDGASKLNQSALTTAKFQSNSITQAKLEDGGASTGISTTNINDAAVTTAKIADSAVTNVKLAGSITHDKIASTAISDALVPNKNAITTGPVTTFSTKSATPASVGLSTTLTLSNTSKPVLIQLNGGGIGSLDPGEFYVYLYKNGSALYRCQIKTSSSYSSTTLDHPTSAFIYLDTAASGTSVTYDIYIASNGTSTLTASGNIYLTCMEL